VRGLVAARNKIIECQVKPESLLEINMKKLVVAALMCLSFAAPTRCDEIRKAKVAEPSWSMDSTPFVLSGDGTLLITAQMTVHREDDFTNGSKWEVRLWQLPKGNLLRTLTLRNIEHLSLALAPDKKTFAVGAYLTNSYGETELYDVETLRQLNGLRRFPEQKEKVGIPFAWLYSGVTGVAFSPDGKWLASVHNSGDISLEEVSGHDKRVVLPNEEPRLKGTPGRITFSSDGKTLINIGSNGTVKAFAIK
jgi:WD40 repeat protein